MPGQSPGTLSIALQDGVASQATVVSDEGLDRTITLTAADLKKLRTLRSGSGAHSISLSAVGGYRVQTVAGADGELEITGCR